jgi:hypothetical protein
MKVHETYLILSLRLGIFSRKFLFSFLLSFFCFTGSLLAQEWQEVKGDHFIVYFLHQDEKFAQGVLSKAEEYYGQIARELGYQRYSDFWTWDKRVKIYIYPEKTAFLKASGQPSWSEGVADYTGKQIISYAWSEGFTDALLPHEMAHLIFRDYVGFKGEIPLWLDEGVAQWMEPQKREAVQGAVKELLRSNKILSLRKMLELDIREVDDANLVHGYYVQAVSLVGYLMTQHGPNRFIEFCRQLRDGKRLEEALRFAYPASIRSLKELETKWLGYISRPR